MALQRLKQSGMEDGDWGYRTFHPITKKSGGSNHTPRFEMARRGDAGTASDQGIGEIQLSANRMQ